MEPITVSAVILFFCVTGLAAIIFGSIGYHLGACGKEREILNRYDLKLLEEPRYVQPIRPQDELI